MSCTETLCCTALWVDYISLLFLIRKLLITFINYKNLVISFFKYWMQLSASPRRSLGFWKKFHLHQPYRWDRKFKWRLENLEKKIFEIFKSLTEIFDFAIFKSMIQFRRALPARWKKIERWGILDGVARQIFIDILKIRKDDRENCYSFNLI